MRIEDWQAWGVIGGTITVWSTLGLLFYAKAVRPVLKIFKRFDTVADQVMGDEKAGIPSLRNFIIVEIRRYLGEHVETWHHPGRSDNGPKPAMRSRR